MHGQPILPRELLRWIIVDAVTTAALQVGRNRGSPLRVWFLGGQGLLDIPTQKYMIVDYMHIFPEHHQTWNKLRSLPPNALEWSILCPGFMHPLSQTTYPLAPNATADNIVATAASGYATALEDNADFIARDLLDGRKSAWIFQKVGVKERR
ncbi:hypothetical protein N7488_011253 [Penicillium malachiteum]|nr:hypothetical protein N7488_011253 [Penicillium malachiteum]